MTPGTILWDFDGTLAFREGMWSGTLLGILQSEEPDMKVSRDDIRPFIRSGFPWHSPDVYHPETADPDVWWENINPLFKSAFLGLGVHPDRASILAAMVRRDYCDPGKWSLFDDSLPTLELLSGKGWMHLVLSNHVPELPHIAGYLGLSPLLCGLYSSALTGHEKPNREAYLSVLRKLPPDSRMVMVGDSIEADIRGATSLGIPAILVRRPAEKYLLCSEDLMGVIPLLDGIRDISASDVLESA